MSLAQVPGAYWRLERVLQAVSSAIVGVGEGLSSGIGGEWRVSLAQVPGACWRLERLLQLSRPLYSSIRCACCELVVGPYTSVRCAYYSSVIVRAREGFNSGIGGNGRCSWPKYLTLARRD